MIRRRLRKFILRIGTLLCVLIAAAFVASGWWSVAVRMSPHGFWAVTHGAVTVCSWKVRLQVGLETAGHEFSLSEWNLWDVWDAGGLYVIPLYAPFLGVAVPTLLVWRFWPKFPRGHCRRCGYNLRGLREARCPECGKGFDGSKQKRARHGGHREREGEWRMAKYAYYFVEGYVVRWRRPGKPQWLAPDGQWREYSDEWDVTTNGRALADEQEALETAEAKFEQNKEWWDKQYPQYKKRSADS